MQCPRDSEWLDAYVQRGDERAFSQLVAAHVDMVYSAALRQVRNRHLAEEVTQVVFIVLARKAKTLRAGTVLPAWLHKTVRFTALNALKVEARRRKHERKAAEMASEFPRVDSSWQWLAPLLDEGIANLSEKERAAVMLRYFEHLTLAETGQALGISEDAAGMRISRAVEKLRGYFSARGVTLSAAALGGVMSANAVHAAPTGLAGIVASKAMSLIAGGGAHSAALIASANAVSRAMFLAKAKVAAAVVGIAVGLGVISMMVGDYVVAPMLRQHAAPLVDQHSSALDMRESGQFDPSR